MVKSKFKKGLERVLASGIILAGSLVGSANAGNIEIKHNTTTGGISKEAVVIKDDDSDASYGPAPTPSLTNYIDGNLKNKSINSQNTEVVKFNLGTNGVSDGTDRKIRIRFLNNSGYEKRNLTVREDPTTVGADTNIYDIWESTAAGTGYGYIDLSNVINPQLEEPWIFRSDNYADINMDAKVNELDLGLLTSYWLTTGHGIHNNWADFTDINRDGDVNLKDFSCFANQWGYDGVGIK